MGPVGRGEREVSAGRGSSSRGVSGTPARAVQEENYCRNKKQRVQVLENVRGREGVQSKGTAGRGGWTSPHVDSTLDFRTTGSEDERGGRSVSRSPPAVEGDEEVSPL